MATIVDKLTVNVDGECIDPWFKINKEEEFKPKDLGSNVSDERKVDADKRSTMVLDADSVVFDSVTVPRFKEFFPEEGEVLLYEPGDHFDWHIDRRMIFDDSVCHIGTLLFVRYSDDAEGGELKVKRDKLNWATSDTEFDVEMVMTSPKSENRGKWQSIFIMRGVPHCVTPLTKGKRMAVKFPVVYDEAREPENPFPWHPSTNKDAYDHVYPADLAHDNVLAITSDHEKAWETWLQTYSRRVELDRAHYYECD